MEKENTQARRLNDMMHEYWDGRAGGFGFDTKNDTMDDMKARIAPHLPGERSRVLDVGTGTGMVATAAALLGHDVTGVDFSAQMLEQAAANSASFGVYPDYRQMNAVKMDFPDDSFDVVINRNVLWAIPHPEDALLVWRRVLKPGGLLIYMDGNQFYFYFDRDERRNREEFIRLRGTGTAHWIEKGEKDWDSSLCDQASYDLPLSRFDRPGGWDEKVLPQLGFDILREVIDRPQALLKYGVAAGSSTHFLIVAINGK